MIIGRRTSAPRQIARCGCSDSSWYYYCVIKVLAANEVRYSPCGKFSEQWWCASHTVARASLYAAYQTREYTLTYWTVGAQICSLVHTR